MSFTEFVYEKCKNDRFGLFRLLLKDSEKFKEMAGQVPALQRSTVRMIESLPDTNSFILVDDLFYDVVARREQLNLRDLSLPFPKCFLEIPATKCGENLLLGGWLSEVGPQTIEVMPITAFLNKQKNRFLLGIAHGFVSAGDAAIPNDAKIALIQTLHDCMAKASSLKTGKATAKESTRSGRLKVSDFVFVRPSKVREAENVIGVAIDWKHCWEVRGHWRQHDGLGKDRNGDYCIKGFTWVVPHKKGNLDMPAVKKTRIVTQNNDVRGQA